MKARDLGVVLVLTAGVAGAAQQGVPAEQLLPLERRSTPLLVTQGPEEGERLRTQLQPVSGASDRWRLSIPEVGVVYLQRRPDGALVIPRIDVSAEHKRIIYDQPVQLLPATIRPGQGHRMQTEARIVDTRDGSVRRGRVVHEAAPPSRETLRLPSGEAEAYVVEARQEIELDAATVTLSVAGGFRAGQGLVYGDARYRVDKPLMFGSSSRHTVELAQAPTGRDG